MQTKKHKAEQSFQRNRSIYCYINQLETGEYTPKPDKLKLIADFFNVSLEFLMRNEDVQWNPVEQTMDYTISLSEEEQDLLMEYRKADDTQKEMIRRILAYSDKM